MDRMPIAGLLLGMFLFATGPAVVLAQEGGGYDLSWTSIDGGGGETAGGLFTLRATLGQPDAGLHAGGGYQLGGGFWKGGGGISVAVGGTLLVLLALLAARLARRHWQEG